MKKKIKGILKSIGLYKLLYGYYIKRERGKFSNLPFCSMNFQGILLKFNTKDAYSKSWFFPRFGKGYIHEPGATKIFIDHINQASNVFDIGGHLGYFSCIAGKLSNNGNVCVFEMDSNCIPLIRENAELNELENIEIYNMAVSDLNGYTSIPKLEFPNPGIRIDSGKINEKLEVATITIDEFIRQQNITPDFIKIDVEGAEYKVLNGMLNTLKQNSLTLLIEIHVSHLLKYYHTNYKDVLMFLTVHGFKLEKVENHREEKMILSEIKPTVKLEGNVMILCKNY